MRRFVPYLLPFALIILILSALALSPLAPFVGAQDGQKLTAATNPSSTKSNTSSTDRRLSYPVTKKIEHVDNYHGTVVADPYRWLEEDSRTSGFGSIVGTRPVPTVGPGALIGFIRMADGQIGQPFAIGSQLTITANADGRFPGHQRR